MALHGVVQGYERNHVRLFFTGEFTVDVEKLIHVLHRLVDAGGKVVVSGSPWHRWEILCLMTSPSRDLGLIGRLIFEQCKDNTSELPSKIALPQRMRDWFWWRTSWPRSGAGSNRDL